MSADSQLPPQFAEFFGSARPNTTSYTRNSDAVFADFFGGNPERFMNLNQEEKAPAIESKLECSLEELYNGASKSLRISRSVANVFGARKTVQEVLTIDIKPGWKKGTKITFPEKGNKEPGITPADLIFVVDEKPHGIFRREGDDLVVTKKLSLLEALTGKTLSLTTLDGRNLRIPTGDDVIRPGDEVVVRNEGMPVSKERGKKGNLVVKFEIVFPARLSDQQKAHVTKGLAGIDE